MAQRSLSTKVVYSLALAAIVYIGLSLWAGWGDLALAARQFNWWWMPVVLSLSCLNYLLRFVKWQYYLRVLGLAVPRRESFMIHLSGLALSITPGKLGEMVKSYFLLKRYGYPVAQTTPIVLADRLTDLLSLVILASIGAIGFDYGQKVVWITAVIMLLIVALVTIRPIGERLLGAVQKIPGLRQRAAGLRQMYESSYLLLRFDRLVGPVLISVVSWGCEAVGFWLIFLGLGLNYGLLPAIFIYAFSTIAGAVAMLPGGLGVTEGAIAGLLRLLTVPAATAALATLLVRAATLWFAVLVGTMVMIKTERRFILHYEQIS
jgi:uncharacterized protein (TIRG00374 family)